MAPNKAVAALLGQYTILAITRSTMSSVMPNGAKVLFFGELICVYGVFCSPHSTEIISNLIVLYMPC